MTEVAGLILFYHLRDAAVRQDVSRVDEAVKHLGSLLDEVTLVGIVFQLVIGL